MRLEERRKKIEEEKQKMETVMSKQREKVTPSFNCTIAHLHMHNHKVGQEAFLRAVAKGIKKSGHQEAGDRCTCST